MPQYVRQTARLLLLAGLCLLFSIPTQAEALSGKDIMTLVHDRPDGEDRVSVMTMTLVNKRGSQRVRQVESYSKDYGRDRKTIMLFLDPADVRDTAYLSWEYEEPGREDDKWLYMPAMKKVRRISGTSRNEYFMGSDFTYDDMGKRDVDKDVHALVGEDKILDHPCWKIESVPVDPEDLYTRRILWVSKEALMTLQAEYHDKDGLVKTFKAVDLRKQDGFWTLFRSEMDNLSRDHKTIMETGSMRYDAGLDDDLFQVSTIQRGRIR